MSSPFTSLIIDTFPIPSDPEHSVTIRKLPPKTLERAAKVAQLDSLADLKDMGGPAFLKELQSLSEGDKAKAESDPLMRYDRVTLLKAGVRSWTYPDRELTVENFEDLDDDTGEHIARAILKLSKPSLFQSKDEAEAAEKNG